MKIDTISTIAIGLGSFLLGGSLGLALSLNDCDICRMKSEIEEIINEPDELIAINKDIDEDDEEVFEEYEKTTSVYITESSNEDDINKVSYLPYVISRDSYENEYRHFNKESLVYFEKDKILVDDRDDIIDNIEMILGSEALSSFGEGSEDNDIVYVRNMRIQCDFEVVREHMSYRENVLGVEDDEEDSEEYLQARRFFNLEE